MVTQKKLHTTDGCRTYGVYERQIGGWKRLRYATPSLLACLRSLCSRKQANAEYGHEEASGRDAAGVVFRMDACGVSIRLQEVKGNKWFCNVIPISPFFNQTHSTDT